MRKKMLKIGLVYCRADLTSYIQRVCLRHRCSYGITGLEYTPFDVIIVPDNIGVYVGFPTLSGMSLPDMPLDQYAEYFRINLLQEYIERGTPIIGVGEGAAMLVSSPMKIGIAKGKPLFLSDDKIVTEFEHNGVYGVSSIEDQLLHDVIASVVAEANAEFKAIKENGDDLPSATAPLIEI